MSGELSRSGLVRLTMLAAAIVCVLVGLRLLPTLAPAASVVREPALIVNDTAEPVLVRRCLPSCSSATDGVSVAPGATLRLGGAGDWIIESAAGRRIGCIEAGAAKGRLPASKWTTCRP